MCPFCVANVAMLAAGVTSTGGLTAFVAKTFSRRARAKRSHRPSALFATKEALVGRAAAPEGQGKTLRNFLRGRRAPAGTRSAADS